MIKAQWQPINPIPNQNCPYLEAYQFTPLEGTPGIEYRCRWHLQPLSNPPKPCEPCKREDPEWSCIL